MGHAARLGKKGGRGPAICQRQNSVFLLDLCTSGCFVTTPVGRFCKSSDIFIKLLINNAFLKSAMLRQGDGIPVLAALPARFTQLSHKLIHRFCGQAGTPVRCQILGGHFLRRLS
ncbi:hypothetical protein Tchl_3446 [Thauera chlorobenzoica]|uniref:Uncharacterized protein n=1 Tax=Thauera chlorobenzoica TaxID=96773 RepID=A0A1L6FHK8_9RHOO|nr:hypothetical protein Tchl_3446 [Thauera chlorobenzoica]